MTERPKAYSDALKSLTDPIDYFLETGIWDYSAATGGASEHVAILPEEGGVSSDSEVSPIQVRKICRAIAASLRRPFIQISPKRSYRRRTEEVGPDKTITKVELFMEAYDIVIPKRKSLTVLVAPLIMAASDSGKGTPGVITNSSCATLWEFRIHKGELWDEYYEYLMNDPVCRAARKLPPLPPKAG